MGQSIPQVNELSPHCGSQMPSPQMHWPPQSNGHVNGLSPHWISQKKLPHAHGCAQSA